MLESIVIETCLVGNFLLLTNLCTVTVGGYRLLKFSAEMGFFDIMGNFDCHIQIPQGLLC
jgi:hypothetical protein